MPPSSAASAALASGPGSAAAGSANTCGGRDGRSLMLIAGGALAGALVSQLLAWWLSRRSCGGSPCSAATADGGGRHPWGCSRGNPAKRQKLEPAPVVYRSGGGRPELSQQGEAGEPESKTSGPADDAEMAVAALSPEQQASRRHRFWCSKAFHDLPCAHRQAAHEGHCRFIHGYSRSIRIFFGCERLDENGFVVDFSSLKELHRWLTWMFDHTMLINEDDPERELFEEMHRRGVADLRIMSNVGMEASSRIVFEKADEMIRNRSGGRCWVFRVETHENSKNCGAYEIVPEN